MSIRTIRARVLRSTLVTYDKKMGLYVVRTREGREITKKPVLNQERYEKLEQSNRNRQDTKYNHLCPLHRSDLCYCEQEN